jgi:hypothetical protein
LPKEAGKLTIAVKSADGTAIDASPYEVDVQGLAASAAGSRARGDGLKSATSGEAAQFSVIVCTDLGVPTGSTAGASVAGRVVAAADNSSVDVLCEPRADGTVACSYTPVLAGAHTLEATLNDEPVQGSPWTIDVAPGKSAGASSANSTARGAGVNVGGGLLYVAEPTSFIVTARRADGLPTNVGGDKLAVVVKNVADGSTVPATIVDEKNGNCCVNNTAVCFDFIENRKILVPIYSERGWRAYGRCQAEWQADSQQSVRRARQQEKVKGRCRRGGQGGARQRANPHGSARGRRRNTAGAVERLCRRCCAQNARQSAKRRWTVAVVVVLW